jgi:predicted nicotinamide N-methyase
MTKKNKSCKSTLKAGNVQQNKKSAAREDADASTTNRPRNLLVTDATQPFTFSFVGRFGILKSVTVNQTPEEDTWPGGALWDLGVLLSEVFVALAVGVGGGTSCTVTTTTRTMEGKPKSTNRIVTLPSRLSEAMDDRMQAMQDSAVVLELGCGVGLTGLVAAAAIGAKCTLLTDLQVVIDRVAQPNVIQNTVSGGGASSTGTTTTTLRPRTINKGKGAVVATPLCWGNEKDEVAVASLLQSLAVPSNEGQSRRKKKGCTSAEQSTTTTTTSTRQPGKMPDVILVGDVAYHLPGAPSHFEALLSTLIKFVDEDTIVVFGTRMRMTASGDMLELLLEHFDELVSPPLRADEIDSCFAGVKHNMSIHFLQRKKETCRAGGETETTANERTSDLKIVSSPYPQPSIITK